MPYPNEHACRLREPGDFEDGSFRRVSREHEGKTYDVIMGRLKGEEALTEQAYRYPKDTWDVSEARDHCSEHEGIEFEPADGERQRPAEGAVERRMFDLEAVDLRVLREEGQPPRIEGHGAVFNKWSLPIMGSFRERILPGAFTKTLKESNDIPSLYNHDPNMVLGRTSNGRLELKEDDAGLWFRVTPTDTGYARDLFTNIEERNVTGNSFGFMTVKDRWHEEAGKSTREIIEARLLDVGPVTFPAYPDTDVAVRHFLDWEQRIGRRLQGKRLEQLATVASGLKDAAAALEELISWASEDDDSASSRSEVDHSANLARLRRRVDVRLKTVA
jgi:hypothetical protein